MHCLENLALALYGPLTNTKFIIHGIINWTFCDVSFNAKFCDIRENVSVSNCVVQF